MKEIEIKVLIKNKKFRNFLKGKRLLKKRARYYNRKDLKFLKDNTTLKIRETKKEDVNREINKIMKTNKFLYENKELIQKIIKEKTKS